MNVFIESYRESINKKERGSKFQMSACDKSFKYLLLSKLIIMNGKELILKPSLIKIVTFFHYHLERDECL